MVGKRLVNTGEAVAPFDPIQNFETVAYTGNGGTQKITGYIKKGAAFNGSSSEIDLPNLGLGGNTTRSVSLWVNPSVTPASRGVIFSYGSGSNGQAFALDIDSSNNLRLSYYNRDYGTSTTVPNNTWTNIVITYNGGAVETASNTKIYINGASQTLSSLGGTYTGVANTSDSNYGMGYRTYTNSLYFEGKIDQVRIFDRALSQSEVDTLEAETFASSTKSTTDIFGDGSGVALYELDEDAGGTGVNLGDIDSGQSINLNTSTSRVVLTSHFSASDFNSTNKSVSLWVKMDSLAAGGSSKYAHAFNVSSGSWAISVSSGGFGFSKYLNGSNNGIATYSTTPVIGRWYNIIAVDDNSTKMKLYVNGKLVATNSYTGGIDTSYSDLGFGDYSDYGDRIGFSGSIDDARIYNGALTPQEVENIFNNSGSITTTLAAHYKFDGNSNDSSSNSYDGNAINVTYNPVPAIIENYYDGTPTNVNFLGMAFQPDLVWIKERTSGSGHFISDSVRGATKVIYSNLANSEDTETTVLTSFDPNGFTVGSSGGVNQSSQGYAAWCWKAGGAAVSNSDGTITSQVSANPDAGFSIVKYTGNNSYGQTVGHGLSAAPELVIIKNLDNARNWRTYAEPLGATKYINLDESAAAGTYGSFNNTAPTTTVFSTTSNVADRATNFNGDDYIAYCFHSTDYQKVGSYTGDGSTSGNIITTGFKPRFLLTKPAGPTGGYWYILDSTRNPSNPRNNGLFPNDSLEEISNSNYNVDFLSNGFELKNNSIGFNQNNETYIYLAIA